MELNIKKVFFGFLIFALTVFICLGILGGFLIIKSFDATESGSKGKNNIAVIDIAGPIMAGSGGGAFGGSEVASSRNIMKQINQVKDDKNIKALLLRVNTPGGSSAASDSIYRELEKFKEKTEKPIVVSMGDVAASGGYYVAANADEILASPSTITGSIGVIMKFNNLQDLYDKIGVDSITIKSGDHKDIGSPNRKMTAEEEKMLQQMVDNVYQQFVTAVADGRNMSEEKVENLADGRIYNGAKAKELGLVDSLGTFHDAVDRTAQLANIKGEPHLIYYNQASPIERLLGSINKLVTNLLFNQALQGEFKRENRKSQILYQQLIERREGSNLENLKLEY
ncbi:MAG: signal peptide peptidase SppA [Halanaerobacter sp.]